MTTASPASAIHTRLAVLINSENPAAIGGFARRNPTPATCHGPDTPGQYSWHYPNPRQRSNRPGVLMPLVDAVLRALSFSFGMTWEILWALILGFTLSAVVQAVVSKAEITRLLPDDSPRCLTIAAALGAASSSCSYAATAMARSLF